MNRDPFLKRTRNFFKVMKRTAHSIQITLADKNVSHDIKVQPPQTTLCKKLEYIPC